MDFNDLELKHIKDLMNAMGRTGTHKIRIKQDTFELELQRENQAAKKYAIESEELASKYDAQLMRAQRTFPRDENGGPHFKYSEEKAEDDSKFIKSPMVGTFYTTPAPSDPPFVKVGDTVEKGQVVCIIEAMKVMNEIKSDVSGTIAEVLVETEHPVEFATKLFKIK